MSFITPAMFLVVGLWALGVSSIELYLIIGQGVFSFGIPALEIAIFVLVFLASLSLSIDSFLSLIGKKL